MVDAANDPGAELTAALQALKHTKAAHVLLRDEAMHSLLSRLIESKAAVAQSRALLDRLSARKPGVFP